MDEGSTITLIDAETARKIGISGPRVPLGLTCIGDTETVDTDSKKVNFEISALDSNSTYKIIQASTVKDLNLFSQSVKEDELKRYKHLSTLPLEFYVDAKPLLLIGQDHWDLITTTKVRYITRNHPVASLTRLGWVVHGHLPTKPMQNADKSVFLVNDTNNITLELTANEELSRLVKFHFTLESIGVTSFKRKNRLEEKAQEILENTAVHKDGYWEVGLLWKNENVKLPNNREDALNRLKSIERKMDKDIEYQRKYCTQMDHLISSGYAEKVPTNSDDDPRTWYLPHFGVVHSNKAEKIRLVFDGAAKTKGISLNDNLLIGPDITNSLLGVLLRFRQKRIAVTGDIREMFLQIRIRKEDRCAQKFLWRGSNRENEPDTYVMKSMMFGSASSPYSAQQIMRKNALEFESIHPTAVKAIINKHYVDDYLDSFDDVEEGYECVKIVSTIHEKGGFEIRNWSSNDTSLLSKLPKESLKQKNVDLLSEEKLIDKTLGLKWNSTTDTISLELKLNKIPEDIAEGQRKPTKREMLRILMSIFDPLGILLPFTIREKMLLQDIWRSGIGWDEKLKDEEFLFWREWILALRQVDCYHIPRAYSTSKSSQRSSELHLFCDASDKAYAAAAYLRSSDEMNNVSVSFVAGKARVAPLKPVSIPRMELQGALLASRLGDAISSELEIAITRRIYWTDSLTVLGWIKADPRKYQTFVAHRLGEIDELTNVEEWRWVPSKLNPADCSTKNVGKFGKSINMWLIGPEFLRLEELAWPKPTHKRDENQPIQEIRKEFVAVLRPKVIYETPTITNFSKWLCLLRSTALLLATAEIWKGNRTKELSVEDLIRAEEHLIKKVQQECFPEDIKNIKENKPLSKGSRVKNLSPFIGQDGILKIDGRINLIEGIPESVKTPVILDGKHHFVKLLVQNYHERFHHGSPETVINELKQKYWIIKIRPTVRAVTSRCQICRISSAKAEQPRMGNLPAARLSHHRRPFTFCGLDYFGPMSVTIGRRHEKRWGALFTCLTTRAIHLELVSSLSSDSAIMALRRMSNRRGTPLELYSDNGTNFTGADRELRKSIEECHNERFQNELVNMKIKWRYNPPQAPHMGGSWERLVKSVKKSLSTILNERAPKEETLATLLTEVENTVNSRPLTNVSVNPLDAESLTPNHLLIGSSSGAAACGMFSADDLNCRKQWRKAQRLAVMFWKRWLKEYVPNLVVRKCWNQEARNLMIGDVVLVVDSNMPRNTWPRGKITQVYPGKDGRVRVVEVSTRGKNLKRAANKIIVLVPMHLGTENQPSRTEGEDVHDVTMQE